nr:MAG TPA: hypothetical protein [Caudoviricetes sp.]
MERLTKYDTDGQAMMDCQKCEADWTGKHGKPMVDCTALYCRNRLKDRLAAYEETELTPEEVLSMKFEWCAMMDALNSIGGGYTRLRELAEADRAGRLVVLPCKVGDTLWVTGRDNVPREMKLEAPDIRAVCTDEDNLCMSTCNRKPDGFCAYRLRNDGADVGKTVFLTREEAEKALEAMKDE